MLPFGGVSLIVGMVSQSVFCCGEQTIELCRVGLAGLICIHIHWWWWWCSSPGNCDEVFIVTSTSDNITNLFKVTRKSTFYFTTFNAESIWNYIHDNCKCKNDQNTSSSDCSYMHNKVEELRNTSNCVSGILSRFSPKLCIHNQTLTKWLYVCHWLCLECHDRLLVMPIGYLFEAIVDGLSQRLAWCVWLS